MHKFNYKGRNLYCEQVPVEKIAKKYGTPFYLYSRGTLVDHFLKIKDAFSELGPVICFSMKSNSNLAVLETLVSFGAGLDIVSGGELYRASKAGCDPKRIVYASVGKKPEEIMDAIWKGILLFNVESEPELARINKIAHSLKKKVACALRVNPDVEAHTHHYITTGKSENKFGLDFKTAAKIFKNYKKYPNVDICGVHIHIGSQITESSPFEEAIKKTLKFIDANKISLKFFNIGGGLGIIYSKETPQTAMAFAYKVVPLLKGRNFKLILEPGRFIAGNSGVLVTKALYIKQNPSGKMFAIVDAGMNDLIRPSLYSAYHEIVPVVKNGKTAKKLKYDIVGPICESGDFLAKDRTLPEVKQGDLLCVMGAGAYGFTMSSNYNSRPRVPEIMVSGKKVNLVRERETYSDLVKLEKIPVW